MSIALICKRSTQFFSWNDGQFRPSKGPAELCRACCKGQLGIQVPLHQRIVFGAIGAGKRGFLVPERLQCGSEVLLSDCKIEMAPADPWPRLKKRCVGQWCNDARSDRKSVSHLKRAGRNVVRPDLGGSQRVLCRRRYTRRNMME